MEERECPACADGTKLKFIRYPENTRQCVFEKDGYDWATAGVSCDWDHESMPKLRHTKCPDCHRRWYPDGRVMRFEPTEVVELVMELIEKKKLTVPMLEKMQREIDVVASPELP